MSKYAYIVAATGTYTPELVALLNSLDYVGNTHDVVLIGIELSDVVISQFSKLSYNVIHINVTEEEWQRDHGRSEVVCRKRYWYAAEYGKNYEAVCVLDADMIFVRNPECYFEIAANTRFILGASKEQNKVYDDEHHKFNNEWVIPKGYYNQKDLCNCPLFIDARKYSEALKIQWDWFDIGFPDTNMKCPDMDIMNIAFIKYVGEDNIIVLTGPQWLGTNEQLLKPYMRAITDRGLIKMECGIPVFSFHGQYYYKAWRENQLANRHQCANGYLKATENSDSMAQGAMNTLHQYFKLMLDYKIIIKKIHYRHPEQEYEG